MVVRYGFNGSARARIDTWHLNGAEKGIEGCTGSD